MRQPHPSVFEGSSTRLSAGRFQNTRWSMVRAAKAAATADKALSELCQIHWYPVYAFIRRSGWSAEDAIDHTQAFFLEFLKHKDFDQGDPPLDRLRSHLLGAVKHHLAQARDRAQAIKRGGEVSAVSIDEAWAERRYALEPSDDASPDKLYDRRWATNVIANAMKTLRTAHERKGRQAEFEVLLPFLSWNCGEDYKAVAATLGISEVAARVRVSRLRFQLRKAVEAEIADTVSDENEIAEELNFLREVLSQPL